MSDVVIPSETRSTDDALRMASVLIVEDQLLIAMDIEHALIEHGVKNVRTVSSVYEGQQALQKDMPDIALLDLNLGDETSVKIANALRDRHVPFLFATGYADGSMIPAEFNNVPVIRKPYAVHTVIREMTKLLVSSAAHHQDME